MNTDPNHPNRVEAGKRPRVTLTPTLVLKNGFPILAVSVAGGDFQDQTGLNVLLNHIDFGMLPKEAVSAPRFYTNHHQDSFNPSPDRQTTFVGRGELCVNDEISSEVRHSLADRGHIIKKTAGPIGMPVMIFIEPGTGMIYAAGDPKANRHAGALP